MKFLKIEATPHWGLLLNYHGFTKSRPALKTVPPTTLIGGIAHPIALMMKWPEKHGENSAAERIRGIFEGIYVCQNLPLTEYGDLSRIFSYDRDDKQILKDAAAVTKLYRGFSGESSDGLKIVFIIDESKASKVLGESWEWLFLCSAWSLSRIGARESVVSVKSVTMGEPKVVPVDEVETSYYFPLKGNQVLSHDYFVASVVDWRNSPLGDYVGKPTVQLVVPYNYFQHVLSPIKVRPKNREVYLVDGEALIPW